jgi:hypothetical protein
VRHISPRLCAQASCIFLLLLFAAAAYGQLPNNPSSARLPQRIPAREQALGNLSVGTSPVERQFEREKRILLATLKEDFRQLQIVNNELMQRVFVPRSNNTGPITPKEIRGSLSEIQSRARRFKVNFRLPEVSTERSLNEHTYATLSSGLLMLDETVMRFVGNPIFQQLQVVDARLSVQAAEDLNAILRLTDSLHKLAKDDRKQ